MGLLIGQEMYVNSIAKAYDENRAYIRTASDNPFYTIIFERESAPEFFINTKTKATTQNNRNLLNKSYGEKKFVYSRRLGVKSNSKELSFEMESPYFTTSDGHKIGIELSAVPEFIPNDSLKFPKLLDYLKTNAVNVPSNADSLNIVVSSYSKGAKDLLSKKFTLNVFLKEIPNGRNWRFGNFVIDTTDNELRQSQTLSFSMPQSLKGKEVTISIEVNGLKANIDNAKYGRSHVYTDKPEQINKNLILAKKETKKKDELMIQNYPNPFNPVTTINYQISNKGLVVLKVYDVLGREIAILVNEEQTPGNYKVNFNASEISSGVYFYHLQSIGVNQVRKMIVQK